MNPGTRKKRTPDPSATRTDRDWVMIVLGVLLIIVFAVGGYMSLVQGDRSTIPKSDGPAKDLNGMSMSEPWEKDANSRPVQVFAVLRG